MEPLSTPQETPYWFSGVASSAAPTILPDTLDLV
jgi:hypothetical protein